MMLMYEKTQEREWERMKFDAKLVGVNLDNVQTVKTKEGKDVELPSTFVFGEPSDYVNLSSEEKDELTKKMKGMHHNWASNKMKDR